MRKALGACAEALSLRTASPQAPLVNGRGSGSMAGGGGALAGGLGSRSMSQQPV